MMAMTSSGWIFAGKMAVVLLPTMLIAIVVTLVVALLRDRATRSADPKHDQRGADSD